MVAQSKIITVLGTALFLSLSANLFMGGKMLGQSYQHRPDAPPRGGEDSRREEWKKRDMALREKLNEADRAIVKAHMEGQREKFKAMKESCDAAEDKVDAAKSAEPFDQAALETALKEQAEHKAALIGEMRAARASMMEKLSPEGREVMKKNGPRFHGREGGREGRDRDGWRGRDREGDRGGKFFDRRPDGPPDDRNEGPNDGPRGEGPRGEGYGESGRPPLSDGPPPPPEDAPPPPADAPPAP